MFFHSGKSLDKTLYFKKGRKKKRSAEKEGLKSAESRAPFTPTGKTEKFTGPFAK